MSRKIEEQPKAKHIGKKILFPLEELWKMRDALKKKGHGLIHENCKSCMSVALLIDLENKAHEKNESVV